MTKSKWIDIDPTNIKNKQIQCCYPEVKPFDSFCANVERSRIRIIISNEVLDEVHLDIPIYINSYYVTPFSSSPADNAVDHSLISIYYSASIKEFLDANEIINTYKLNEMSLINLAQITIIPLQGEPIELKDCFSFEVHNTEMTFDSDSRDGDVILSPKIEIRCKGYELGYSDHYL